MLRLFQALLPLLSIFQALGVEAEDVLVRRALTATDLFSFHPVGDPGGCSADKIAQITSMIPEITALHDAAVSAYGFGLGTSDAKHIRIFLGVQVKSNLQPLTLTDDDMYDTVGDRLSAVTQFLKGDGVKGAQSKTPPLFLCSDDFATITPWDQPVKDKMGNPVPKAHDENNPITIEELFVSLQGEKQGGRSVEPFWVDFLKAYMMFGTDVNRLCFDTLYASTPKSENARSVFELGVDLGTFDRFIFFCDQAWTDRPGRIGNTQPPPLSSFITYDGYPTAGSGVSISNFVPVSATLYHELFHLTDYGQPTNDPFGTPDAITKATDQQFNNPKQNYGADRKQLVDNPESYLYFSVASYLARNPPETPAGSPVKPEVLFWGPQPIAASG